MRVMCADLTTQEVFMTFEIDTTAPSVAPAIGDIIDYPKLGLYRVVQRVFQLTTHDAAIQLLNPQHSRALDVTLQVACARLQVQEVNDSAK